MTERGAEGTAGTAGMAAAAHRHGRALAVLVLLSVAGCAAGTWWQVHRALAGNLLSDLYSFLWPLYGCYVLYLWARLRRGATTLVGQPSRPDPVPARRDDELEEYNRYLAANRAAKLAAQQALRRAR